MAVVVDNLAPRLQHRPSADSDVAVAAAGPDGYGRLPDRTKLRAGSGLHPSLATALKKWQLNAGLEPTGTLDVGQILVLPARCASR